MAKPPKGRKKTQGPATREYKSGAQKRRERHERDEAERAQVVARARELGVPIAGGEQDAPADDEAWALEFREAGDPDLENPDTDLAYVRKLQLICLRQMATTAHPSKAQQETWKRIREMSAVVGLTSNRAKMEADLRALKQQLRAHRDRRGAMKQEPGHAVVRPATARGQRGARGPRPLPGSGAGAPKGQDERDPPLGGR